MSLLLTTFFMVYVGGVMQSRKIYQRRGYSFFGQVWNALGWPYDFGRFLATLTITMDED